MKSLRSKASHFFRDRPSRDEKTAIADSSDIDFDAGIQDVGMRKKPSRFFGRKNDKLNKPLPTLPSNSNSSTPLVPVATCVTLRQQGDSFENLLDYEDLEEEEYQTSSPALPPASRSLSGTPEHKHIRGGEPLKSKSRPNFVLLREKGSCLFGGSKNNDSTQSPTPPPVPQIPTSVPFPKARRPVLTPLSTARGSRGSLVKIQNRSVSISRPQLMAQLCSPPIPEDHATVPFEKRPGPPPPRPPRPDSLDEKTLAFMRESGTRMNLPSSNRGSTSTATASTPRSQASSIEARLGFPSGHGTPRTCSIEPPLAARFTLDPNQALPVRDSSGDLVLSRFSEFVRYQRQRSHAVDGVDAEDREIGPIELWDPSKEGDWTLEKQISQGRDGRPGGMLFRDRWGGFHFVADI
ncbi:hypothetical protein BKA58DRAFT_388689 [Alternaria rosae]|uniref:uncharacterized protein n=1 Tax=Alternaria rosae TaxID=1187941 RepID=UPI001E8E45E9|nr:uncharacterized protein BKA58DRAFT_388689 [Alternaria rosae]KAH6866822.1 hypothetical protein BKA58DRAFT_388689 [Alternaria rosae]